MTIDVPSASSPTYCTAADVAAVQEKTAPSAHADDGEATVARYNRAILAQEEYIDRHCRQAWRTRTVTNHYPKDDLGWRYDIEGFVNVALPNVYLKDLSTAAGDKIEVWDGTAFVDWLNPANGKVQGRAGDFYLVPERGVLKVKDTAGVLGTWDDPQDRLRVTYRYGQAVVPFAIQEACAMLVAAVLQNTAYGSQSGQGQGTDFVPADNRTTRWRNEANKMLEQYRAVLL